MTAKQRTTAAVEGRPSQEVLPRTAPIWALPGDVICDGESLAVQCWRRERDSNPRYGFPQTRFPSVRLQPLGHPSGQGEAL
jgi:hypothetical protein